MVFRDAPIRGYWYYYYYSDIVTSRRRSTITTRYGSVKSNNLKTIRSMFPKTSPQTSGAIQARLTHLRNRKAALDEAIASLERYAVYAAPPGAGMPRRGNKVVQMKNDARLAGAA